MYLSQAPYPLIFIDYLDKFVNHDLESKKESLKIINYLYDIFVWLDLSIRKLHGFHDHCE
jgi:hypothetical protein